MYTIKFLLSIVFIALVNGANFSKRQQVEFEDGTSTELVGLWFIHRLQGDSAENERIKCYCANVTKEDSHYRIEKHIVTKSGEKLNYVVGGVLNDSEGVAVTFYKFNADGSRGPKVCDLTAATSGHIVKYTALGTCKCDNFATYNTICISKNKELSKDDKKALDILCPPNLSLQLQTNC